MSKNVTFAALFILLIASALLYIMNRPGKTAEIYVDGTLVKIIELDKFSGVYRINEHNSARVENGSIRMETADCPDKLCIAQGAINDGGYPIICLPNKVVIKIKGGTVDANVGR